jgi:hypothetical protein
MAVVGIRAAWTCMSYDARGRVTSVSIAAFGGPLARTVKYYAMGGDPLTTPSDAAGTVTTVSDLLGRPVTYTDVWGTVTSTSYDMVGRAFQTSTKPVSAAATTVGVGEDRRRG